MQILQEIKPGRKETTLKLLSLNFQITELSL